ncbi:MAG: hypothetical protein R3Y04_02300 [Rikenellaceae bacterium]
MKRAFLFAAMIFVLCGCENSDIIVDNDSDNTPLADELTLGDDESSVVTIEVNASEYEPESRVAVYSDAESGDLITVWKENDKLGGWSSGDSGFNEFTMKSISSSATTATFSGAVNGASYRLIHPFDGDAVIANNIYTIDLSNQSVDMSDEGLNSMGDYTYMISEEIEVSNSNTAPTMLHVGAALNISMRFANLPSDELVIQSITLGGGDGMKIPQSASLDLTKEVTDSQFIGTTTTDEGTISVTVLNSPIIQEYDDSNSEQTTYSVKLNTIPFTLETNESIELVVSLAFSDGSKPSYSETFSIKNSSSSVSFSRATYMGINYSCDMSGATTGNWYNLASSQFESGNGSLSNPYKITNGNQLAKLAVDINSAATTYYGYYFELANDIDISANEWYAIGLSSTISFQGYFDGCGYQISGLYINTTEDFQALFGAAKGATITNLSVSGSVTGGEKSAGIVGYATGPVGSPSYIINCHNNVTVTSIDTNKGVGGVVGYGYDEAVILSCSNTASVSGITDVGGIVGYASEDCKITLCYNSGNITSTTSTAGAIAGQINESTTTNITYCYNTGIVTSGGALAGTLSSTANLSNSYYLESTQSSAVTSNSDSNYTNVTSKTEEELKSATFLALLNQYVETYNSTNTTTQATPWQTNSDGFPGF